MPEAKHRSADGAASRRTLPAALRAHCWQPGQSGNPGGQSGDYGEALRLTRRAAPAAVRRLIELMDSDDERVAAVACNAILDRALGKPAALPAVPIGGPGCPLDRFDPTLFDPRNLTEEQVDRLLVYMVDTGLLTEEKVVEWLRA
jgi:hypothetical protein